MAPKKKEVEEEVVEKEVNPLECEICGHIAGAPFTFRMHMRTHEVEDEKVEEDKPKKKK